MLRSAHSPPKLDTRNDRKFRKCGRGGAGRGLCVVLSDPSAASVTEQRSNVWSPAPAVVMRAPCNGQLRRRYLDGRPASPLAGALRRAGPFCDGGLGRWGLGRLAVFTIGLPCPPEKRTALCGVSRSLLSRPRRSSRDLPLYRTTPAAWPHSRRGAGWPLQPILPRSAAPNPLSGADSPACRHPQRPQT